MIQFAHKRADKNFNDIVAQSYQQEFKTQEKAKHEHIRQAKEKAIEEQRVSEENKLSCWGLLQIMQSVHGQVSNLSTQDYLDKAVSIYQGSGGTAW